MPRLSAPVLDVEEVYSKSYKKVLILRVPKLSPKFSKIAEKTWGLIFFRAYFLVDINLKTLIRPKYMFLDKKINQVLNLEAIDHSSGFIGTGGPSSLKFEVQLH